MTTVAVIGGGLVGSAAAVWLLADGFDVTVFERDPEGRPASTGNAGVISLPEISPLARPGTLASVPGWLLDPLGPLTLRARDLPALTPWLARFVAVGAAEPGRARHRRPRLPDEDGARRPSGTRPPRRPAMYMRRNGALYLYDTDAGFRSGLAEWKERARHGVDYREVDGRRRARHGAGAEGRFRPRALRAGSRGP